MKKVSIIIPCFNQGKHIKEAIESALNQTYENIEIVCVNDGSSDNSSRIIKNLADKYKNIIFFDLKENKGVVNAKNLAIDASSGEYILPLDADDKIESTYVEKAVEVLNNNLEVGIVYCRAKFFGKKEKEWKLPEFNFDNFLYKNCIFNSALFRKSDFYKTGKYKENMKDGCEDWDLWLSLVELGLKPYKINEILFNYRQYENKRTENASNVSNWKNAIILNHINLYFQNKEFASRVFSNRHKEEKTLKKYKITIFFLVVLHILFIIFCSFKNNF